MKKTIYCIILIALLMIAMSINIQANSTTEAKELINLDKKINLSIEYKYDDLELNDINLKIYYIATISEDFQYELSSDFNKYPISLNGVENSSDWDIVRQTLEAYINADKINETLSLNTTNNRVSVNDLNAGLYLIVTEKIDTDKYILDFESFILSLPTLNEDGYFDYDVKVNPKAISYTPKYEEVTYTVIKQWEDDKIDRPESVEIEIYHDGELTEKKELSSENDWMYSWIIKDDGSEWTVVERNVPEEYHVSILKKDNKITVINSLIFNPATSDNITNYVSIFIVSFVVLVGVLAYLVTKKKDK